MTPPHFEFRSPPSAESRHTPQDAVKFVLSLARALHTYGYNAQQLEEALAGESHRLGLIAQFFSTPTSIFAAFGPQDDQRVYLLRVEPGDVDLGKLAELDRATLAVVSGDLSPAQGARRIAEIVAAPPPYGELLTTLAFGVSSGAVSRFLGGGWREMAVGAAIGLVIGLLALGAARRPAIGRVFEFLAAFLGAGLATAAGVLLAPLNVLTTTLAGIIILLPGLTLTTALQELASRHLSSGIARLSSAFMVFLAIAFGVALGGRLAAEALGVPPVAPPPVMPGWTLVAALLLVPLAFTVLLRALPRDVPWIVASGALAFLGSRIGSDALGPELGGFIGALVVGVASNLYARFLDRPANIPLVPGVLLLVPGSIGYRSLASLLERDTVSGVEAAFRMVLIAVSLVAGLLAAQVVSPERRSLDRP